ncbi:MAG: phosphoglucosamine mutase [Bacteroidales bacterium]|jgi:phosphomannomutase|nr:phosphoglucosamine mutase [Bacteroidales bacterium]
MSLIKSISGIRGTIGGVTGNNLTPIDIVKFTAAYSAVLRKQRNKQQLSIVIGRDARVSGEMITKLISGTLMNMGVHVIDIGLSTTPTVEMEVISQQADGGIIITASHNPAHWNALKLLNEKGECLSASDSELVLQLAENNDFSFATTIQLGTYTAIEKEKAIERHIEAILRLALVDVAAIKQAHFKIAIDCVNSTGGIAVPKLLDALGVSTIYCLHCDPNGRFPHNPEPLPQHLTELSAFVKQKQLDMGFSVDPDVDRLAIVKEDGDMFGEEYTIVAVSDYVLQHTKGDTVSNLSSSQALKVISEQHNVQYYASAVGEVNVVEMMKKVNAVIGGEGNGGVIYPELHYGRDALVGIALFLSYLAKSGLTLTQLREKYPNFHISKNSIELDANLDTDKLFSFIKEHYKKHTIMDIDGIRIDFEGQWVHLRKSNTEPIIRIYAESDTEVKADNLAQQIIADVRNYIQQ